MNSVREIAQSIIAEMEGKTRIPNPSAALTYKRIALIDYAQMLKRSPHRTKEENERALEDVYVLAEKAIALGVSQEAMDESLRRIRFYWVSRL